MKITPEIIGLAREHHTSLTLANQCINTAKFKTEEEQKNTWKERKQHTINALTTATEKELLVILADKTANLLSMKEDLLIIGEKLWGRFNAKKEDLKWYYTTIGEKCKEKLQNKRMIKIYAELLKIFDE